MSPNVQFERSKVRKGLLYWFNGISTPYGLFNAKIFECLI